MVQLFADLDIESGIRILQYDILFRRQEIFCVEVLACTASLGDGINVGPF